VDERCHREFFDENTGAVSIGEGGVEIDDGDAGVNEENAADFRAHAENVGRRFVKVVRDQGA
jgi:hypothetical protein